MGAGEKKIKLQLSMWILYPRANRDCPRSDDMNWNQLPEPIDQSLPIF